MYNKAPIYVLPACAACGALCNEKKDEKRFLRRHPAKCKAHAQKRVFVKQLAADVKSVTYDHAIIKDDDK